ncbi:MAG TPA: MgtC/SapB family protein [Vicinamibacterales bacterium]|nr:MgtC/SapB family protein [Vicinamibacterales bacterium]
MDVITVPHTTLTLVLRLILATALGAAVGVDREMRLKPAGLRTHALVALGAALFGIIALTMSSAIGFIDFNAASRIVQGIVAGIGFIGGGVILRRQDKKSVHGLSTAASIWVVSAIGVATGFGLWRAALTAVILALMILALGAPLDRKLREWSADQSD